MPVDAGMRIEVGHHAADRRFDELLVADVLDVFLAHVLEHFGQQPRIPPGHLFRCGRCSSGLGSQHRVFLGLDRAADRQAEAGDDARHQDEDEAERH